MKHYLLFFLFGTLAFGLFAQSSSLNLTLKVYTKTRKVLANTPITFTNENTGERIIDTTNISGVVSIMLEGGKAWQIDVLKIRRNPAWKIIMPSRGSGKKKMDVVYDYAYYLRKTAPPVDRSSLNLKTEAQKVKAKTKFTSKLARMDVFVGGINRQPIKGISVSFVSYKLNKTFTATSDKKGMAYFLLPVRQNYQIDLDGVENYNFKDIGKTGMYKLKCTYVPTNIDEKVINDTIVQNLPTKITGTTAREYVILKLKLTKGGGISNEPIFLRESISGKVYQGETNEKGTVHFLVPKGKIYAIDYTHEKEIDAFDLTYDQGIGHTGKEIMYESKDFFYMTKKEKAFQKKKAKQTHLAYKERELLRNIDKEINELKPLDLNSLLSKPTETTSFSYDFIPIPTDNGKQQALFFYAFKAPKWSKENFQKSLKQTNLCLLIDVSGSMTGEMEQLKKSIKKYIDLISDKSQLSIITFNDAPYLLLPPLSVKENRQYFKDQIDRLHVGGGTNIYKGLEFSYKELLKTSSLFKDNQIIMFTDGYGTRSTNDVIDMSVSYQEKNIQLAPVGIGNYHYEFMELLAGGVSNFQHYLSGQDLENYFEENLLHAIQKPIITNYKYQFLFDKTTKGAEILPLNHKMKESPLKNKSNSLSPLAYQEKVYKFIGEKSDLEFSLSYKNEETGEKTKFTKTFQLNWNKQNTVLEEVLTIHQKRLLIRSEMNHSLKKITDANLQNDYKTIEKEIDVVLKLTKQLDVLNHDLEVREIAQKLEYLNKLISTFKLEVK